MTAPALTYVIVPSYPLTDFLFEEMHGRDDLRIVRHPMPPRRRFIGLLRALEVYLLPWWKGSFNFGRDYIEQLARIRPEDEVLFFAVENRKDLQIARKFIAARHQSVWLWNPIANYRRSALSRWWYRHWMARAGLDVWTFDPADVQADLIGLAPQVYRHVRDDAAPVQARHDVYFLGCDKGRLAELQALRGAFERAGLTTDFRVMGDKRRRYCAADRAQLATQWLPYQDSLEAVRASRAVLELLQSTQSGPTIRSMEAMFLGRKLITDNAALRDTPLYHPSRIFILGQDDLADIQAFIASPLEPLSPAALQRHDIQHWIRQFGARGGARRYPARAPLQTARPG